MVEEERGQRVHDEQVSSYRDRGERRGDGQGESEAESEGWSGGSGGDSAEEKEEDRMTDGYPGGGGDTLTALSWGTQETGAGGIQVGARAGGSDARNSPSAAANKVGMRGRHGARQGQGEKDGGWRENVGGVNLVVRGNKGVRKASGAAENPGGGRHGVGGGVESPQGADTPGVAEGPRWDETLGGPTSAQDRRGADEQGRGGGDENPPTT